MINRLSAISTCIIPEKLPDCKCFVLVCFVLTDLPKPVTRPSIQKRATQKLQGTKGAQTSAKMASGDVTKSKACVIM